MSRASFNDPNYAAKVAVVCCALNNFCMYANDCNELRYVPDPDLYVAGCGLMFGPISTALDIQSALSGLHNFLTRDSPLQPHQSKQRKNLFTHCGFVVL